VRIVGSGRFDFDALLNQPPTSVPTCWWSAATAIRALRELMLGGVTRELLQHMTLPVLMSH